MIVSKKSRQKGKTTVKKSIYAQIGVRYYAVFDPLQQIQGEDEMDGALLRVWSISPDGYTELTPNQGISAIGQSVWLNAAGVGLTLWEGQFEEEVTRLWLRWCNRDGQVIPTGAEGQEVERQGKEIERQRADAESQRADRLAERLREMGINPDEI